MRLTVQTAVGALKAVAEPTRLRVLVLLSAGELNVKDLTRILGQSQPRISRHLKLLAEAGLVERAPEGSWVYFRLAETGQGGELARLVLERIDRSDPQLVRDLRRAEALQHERRGRGAGLLPVQRRRLGQHPRPARGRSRGGGCRVRGAGTRGRSICSSISAPAPGACWSCSPTASGAASASISAPPCWPTPAPSSSAPACSTRRCARATSIDLPLADQAADAVVMHQVLHFLSDPQPVLREAARVLAPGGRLLIVDFAPHELEFLREQFAHERLGFAGAQVQQWLADCGLEVLETRELSPPGDAAEGKLTVSMWLAGRPGALMPRAAVRDERKLERAT